MKCPTYLLPVDLNILKLSNIENTNTNNAASIKRQIFVAQWRHMMTQIMVEIGPGNDIPSSIHTPVHKYMHFHIWMDYIKTNCSR